MSCCKSHLLQEASSDALGSWSRPSQGPLEPFPRFLFRALLTGAKIISFPTSLPHGPGAHNIEAYGPIIAFASDCFFILLLKQYQQRNLFTVLKTNFLA